MHINLIAAVDASGGMGRDGSLPWPHIAPDMKRFYDLTTAGRSAVIMGRKTWDSLIVRHRPLKNRHNIIMSRTMIGYDSDDYSVVSSYFAGVHIAVEMGIDTLWVIGGAAVYNVALCCSGIRINRVYLTRFDHVSHGCDTFFPMSELYANYTLCDESSEMEQYKGYKYKFLEFIG
jgi:dihydrofolate reductase